MRQQHGGAFGVGKDDVERHRSYAMLIQRRRAGSVKVSSRRILVVAAPCGESPLTSPTAALRSPRWKPSKVPRSHHPRRRQGLARSSGVKPPFVSSAQHFGGDRDDGASYCPLSRTLRDRRLVIVALGERLFLRKANAAQAGVERRFGDGDKLGIAVPWIIRAPSCQRIDLGSQLQ